MAKTLKSQKPKLADPVMNSFRLTILQNIFEYLQQITQWLPFHPENASEYSIRADTLVQLLEVEDCGSVGGFDYEAMEWTLKSLLISKGAMPRLFDRFLFVLYKYHSANDIKPVCGFTVAKIRKYLLQVEELREKVIRGR